MSVEVTSVPPWKRELLERKRRQDQEEHRRQTDGSSRPEDMPAWKRDILMKKQHQRNTMVFISKSGSPSSPALGSDSCSSASEYGVSPKPSPQERKAIRSERQSSSPVGNHITPTVTVNNVPGLPPMSSSEYEPCTDEHNGAQLNGIGHEHLIPIQQNPWLKTDQELKRHSHHGRYSYSRENEGHSETGNRPHSPIASLHHDSSYSESDGYSPHPMSRQVDDEDDVFRDEEEVAYGRGFVHKLLRKFKHMSAHDDGLTPTSALFKSHSPRRTCSSDDILEDNKSSYTSPNKLYVSASDGLQDSPGLAKGKAHSMENICLSATTTTTTTAEHVDYSSGDCLPISASVDNLCRSPPPFANVSTCSQDESEMNRSSSKENLTEEEEQPRANIVSVTRSVFESISTGGDIAVYKSKQKAPEPPVSLPDNMDKKPNHAESIADPHDPGIMNGDVEELKETSVNRRTEVGHNMSKHTYEQREESPVYKHAQKDFGKDQHFPKGSAPVSSEILSKNDMVITVPSQNMGADSGKGRSDINANHSNKVESISIAEKPAVRSAPIYRSSGASVTSSSPGHINAKSSTILKSNTSVESPPPKPLPPARRIKTAKDNQQTTVRIPKNDFVESRNKQNATLSSKQGNNVDHIRAPKVSSAQSDESKTSQQQTEQRNPEANRLNLNLNLTELNPKKPVATDNGDADTKLDSNRNQTNDYDSIPVPRRRNKKRAAATSGPGSILIRPASNLVQENTKVEYLNLTKYNDVRTGEFAPAIKRYSCYEDSDEDIPVTNIDDYYEIPITNIDDLAARAAREGDASQYAVRRTKYEFEGAGVVVDRSLLTKTKKGSKMRLKFSEEATCTFEYPSEQCLLAIMSPEPDDDANNAHSPKNLTNGEDIPDLSEPSPSIKATPGLGSSAGALGTYQSRTQIAYTLDRDEDDEEDPSPSRPSDRSADNSKSTMAKPAEEDFSWSEGATSDLLF